MKILFAASEAAPYIKTGGLGDVACSLPKALCADPGDEVAVFLPLYGSIRDSHQFSLEYVTCFYVPLAWRNQYCGIFRANGCKGNLHYYFIDNEYYFYRDRAYGYGDDGERFAFFSKAVLEALRYLNWYPDIIHANDWQTAMVPVFLNAFYRSIPEYQSIRTLFTIHNIEYQGKAGNDFVSDVLGLGEQWKGVMEFDGCTNMMKAALLEADRISTVSRTYAWEIQDPYFSHGLDGILRQERGKLSGVVNGIDPEDFDPAADPLVHTPFTIDQPEEKLKNKRYLQRKLGLSRRDRVPMVAMITRLVGHKGVDLIAAVLEDLMGDDLQLVVIGTGEVRYEDLFRGYAARFPQKLSANIVFDNALAHQLYASADLVLMPSRQEPCGLTQLIAMRYGTVPVVRETGGLVDTVPPYDPTTGKGLGFTFKTYNAHDMLDAVRRGCALFQDKAQWDRLRRNDMSHDSSWARSVEEYRAIYRAMLGR